LGKLDCCKELVQAGATLNLDDNNVATPLDLTDPKKYKETYDYLLSVGAENHNDTYLKELLAAKAKAKKDVELNLERNEIMYNSRAAKIQGQISRGEKLSLIDYRDAYRLNIPELN
jgi:ankyrin repeat protein